MVPRISARRQNRFGLPVAIERMRGRQYRCLRCNRVFYELDELDELDRHLREENPGPDSSAAPRFDEPILLRIFYAKDIREEWGERLKERRARLRTASGSRKVNRTPDFLPRPPRRRR